MLIPEKSFSGNRRKVRVALKTNQISFNKKGGCTMKV